MTKAKRRRTSRHGLGGTSKTHEKNVEKYRRDMIRNLNQAEQAVDLGRCQNAFEHLTEARASDSQLQAELSHTKNRDYTIPDYDTKDRSDRYQNTRSRFLYICVKK